MITSNRRQDEQDSQDSCWFQFAGPFAVRNRCARLTGPRPIRDPDRFFAGEPPPICGAHEPAAQLTDGNDREYVSAMGALTIELPPQRTQTVFNLRRWSELLREPELAKIEGRVETDRYGHVIMSPPPAPRHGSYQLEIGYLLRGSMRTGRVLTECPISTADGVRAADVAWASPECLRELGELSCFPRAPEICVEVLSPGNSGAEIREKSALYFDAGANEVWHCSVTGAMTFLAARGVEPTPIAMSRLCPDFPAQVNLL